MKYLTIKEVAKAIHRCEYTVRNWVNTGRLPSFQSGRARLIREDHLDAFMEQNCLINGRITRIA